MCSSDLGIIQIQRDIGIEVRLLNYQILPGPMRSMIIDFIIFDGTVCYEPTPARTVTADQTRAAVIRTLLVSMPARVRDLEDRFEQLWAAACGDHQNR